MIYCMSDIHGHYSGYKALLSKISFKSTDTLYVLGNVIDGKGSSSMKLLLDMMMRENVYPIIGDHEYAAIECLSILMENADDPNFKGLPKEKMEQMADWVSMGGDKTIKEFRALDDEKREMVVDYLSDFSLNEEVEIGSKKFELVHAGINNFSPDKELDDYDIYELINDAPDYSKKYYDDKYLVTGHMPTRRIFESQYPLIGFTPEGESSPYDKVYMENNHIAINCGIDIGGKLCVVRLDDMSVFYAH